MAIEMDGFRLVLTCHACPEQYDVFLSGHSVGYLRLRHGYFFAEVPFGGKVVYESYPEGDGCFEEGERAGELANAVAAIKQHLLS